MICNRHAKSSSVLQLSQILCPTFFWLRSVLFIRRNKIIVSRVKLLDPACLSAYCPTIEIGSAQIFEGFDENFFSGRFQLFGVIFLLVAARLIWFCADNSWWQQFRIPALKNPSQPPPFSMPSKLLILKVKNDHRSIFPNLIFQFICLNWKIYCDNHCSLSSTTVVHIWIISYIHYFISFLTGRYLGTQ